MDFTGIGKFFRGFKLSPFTFSRGRPGPGDGAPPSSGYEQKLMSGVRAGVKSIEFGQFGHSPVGGERGSR